MVHQDVRHGTPLLGGRGAANKTYFPHRIQKPFVFTIFTSIGFKSLEPSIKEPDLYDHACMHGSLAAQRICLPACIRLRM
jgi:hypothetical protein